MKKIFIFFSFVIFFVACSTNQNTYYVAMPSFKTQTQEQNITHEKGPKVKIVDVEIIKNKFHSSYFEQSTLNQRIDKSLELLKKSLMQEIKVLFHNKGYIVVNDEADYNFTLSIQASLYEDKIQKLSNLSGDNVESSLMLMLEAQAKLLNLRDEAEQHTLTTNSQLDNAININYPIKSEASIETFRQVYSAVPTQINESSANSVLEIDKLFTTFYKELSKNIKIFIPKQTSNTTPNENTNTQDNKELIIFE